MLKWFYLQYHYRRALELNFDITIPPMTISPFKAKYDYTKIKAYLENQGGLIVSSIEKFGNNNDIEGALLFLDENLKKAHKVPGTRLQTNKTREFLNSMENINVAFIEYKRMAGDTLCSNVERDNALNSFLTARKEVNYEVLKRENEASSSLVTDDGKSLWEKIDWNGNYSRKKPLKPFSK